MANTWVRHFTSACFCLIYLTPTDAILVSPFLFHFLSSHLFYINFLFLVLFHLPTHIQRLVFKNKTSCIFSLTLRTSHVFPATHIFLCLPPFSPSLSLFVLFCFSLSSYACFSGLRKTKNNRLTPPLQPRQSGRR